MSPSANQPDAAHRISHVAGWELLEFAVVDSTSFVAAKLGAWHAVRADTQTAGRGRFQRSWVSDAGGLWLSAVVPTSVDRARWQALPLVAGLAVIQCLNGFGLASARLRWPNDVMANERKLAGLLVDTFQPQLAVIGLGINVTNHPAAQDPALQETSTRLADLFSSPPSLSALTQAVLASLKSAMDVMAENGFRALQPRINELWGRSRRVTIDLDGVRRSGLFTGIDEVGRLLLRDDTLGPVAFEPHQVRLLREL
ncbi:MAG: biotin--[acetyl-CoA-carboxylase] ligase [Verrucomicrobiota bacterium]|jgi:BirA family biotin operon repressor/biotin-[acetyl-CoA-carboxylase] ligase